MSEFVPKDTEKRVAEALGLSALDAKMIRKDLQKGSDWDYVNRVVHYSAEGIERLMQSMGIKGGSVASEIRPPDSPAAPGVAETEKTGLGMGSEVPAIPEAVCAVVRLCPNPTWVEAAYTNACGKAVRLVVRVKNNRFMRHGMLIRCVPHPGELGEVHGRWLMIGGR